jgi:hypothetical protein
MRHHAPEPVNRSGYGDLIVATDLKVYAGLG